MKKSQCDEQQFRRLFINNALICFPVFFLNPVSISNVYGQLIQSKQGGSFSLFDSQNFSSWSIQGNANWHFENNYAIANQGRGLLTSRINLTNFILEMEYWIGNKTQSSLFLRCTNPSAINDDTAYRIDFGKLPDSSFAEKPFINVPSLLKKVTNEQWLSLRVSAIGNQFNMSINNQIIIENHIDNRFTSGPLAIGLAEGVLKLRTVRVTIPGRW